MQHLWKNYSKSQLKLIINFISQHWNHCCLIDVSDKNVCSYQNTEVNICIYIYISKQTIILYHKTFSMVFCGMIHNSSQTPPHHTHPQNISISRTKHLIFPTNSDAQLSFRMSHRGPSARFCKTTLLFFSLFQHHL